MAHGDVEFELEADWQGGLHSRRKILSVQNGLAGLQSHTDLGRSHIQGTQLGWQSRKHTAVL
jgi:hypothetical protein